MNPRHDFTGQVALVTGGSSGMGLATAQAFAEAGAALALADVRCSHRAVTSDLHRSARRQSHCPRPHRPAPLTLRFRDFNHVEKIAKLPRPLTMAGVPAGDDPEINDIGYYAPSGDLVLYCGDVGYFNGIVRIGRLDAEDMSVIERQPDGFELMIDRG
jgi:hypothetical protein